MEPPATSEVERAIEEAGTYADLAAQAAAALGREDLSRRIANARGRLRNPDATIAVVGEFKQGKSSLVNALLGTNVCPVDDDIATSTLSILRYGEEARVVAWQVEDGERQRREYSLADLPGLVTEQGNTATGRPELVEVYLSNPLLQHGVTVVDTPGANGVRPGYAAIVLGYLQAVHGAIFVTDASSPLTHEELEFLEGAAEVAPACVIALSKTDMFPHWREVYAANGRLLETAGLALECVPVSSVLREGALADRDPGLNDESGFPALIQFLEERVAGQMTTIAVAGVLDAAILSLAEMQVATRAGLDARLSPGTMEERLQASREAKARLERLRQGNARWPTVMNDGLTELVARVDHQYRRRMRDLQRHVDDELARGDPKAIWAELTVYVREQAAEVARDVVREMEAGADSVAQQVTSLLAEEDLQIGTAVGSRPAIDLSNHWAPRPLSMPSIGSTVGLGLSGLRGAQGGLILLGMMTGLAGIVLSTGVLLGIAAVFGGRQVLDERKRQVAVRRQEARTAIRQFLDEAEFEVNKALRDLSREQNRRLREHYNERISERIRTCAETVATLERGLQESGAAREAQISELREQDARLEAMLERLVQRRNEIVEPRRTS